MMQFSKLNEVHLLIADSKKLKSFHKRFAEATKKGNKGRIDKHLKGFNMDSRFSSFSVKVSFSNYTGHYGDSSVSSFMNLKSAEAGDALVEYLNANEEAVIQGVADILMAKAMSKVEQAKAEISEASEFIEETEKLRFLKE